ncbi:MAG: EthD family reductase [Lapillicoccus sp.]
MTHQLIALYNHPVDVGAFDDHYEKTHSQLALTLPGLRSFTVSRPGPDAQGSPPAYYLVAVLTFDDAAALGAAMAGPEGQATAGDLANFAGAGVALLDGDTVVYL